MKDTKFGLGYYFSLVASVVSLIACAVYASVMYTQPSVYVFLVLTVVTSAVVMIMGRGGSLNMITDYLPVVNAALNGLAAGFGVSLMVNQIGYVISGLDGMETIMTFIIFEVVVVVALILNIIASFMAQRV